MLPLEPADLLNNIFSFFLTLRPLTKGPIDIGEQEGPEFDAAHCKIRLNMGRVTMRWRAEGQHYEWVSSYKVFGRFLKSVKQAHICPNLPDRGSTGLAPFTNQRMTIGMLKEIWKLTPYFFPELEKGGVR